MSTSTMPGESEQYEPVQVIAVTSGKGGVGKTNVSINLGTALSKGGQSVLLLDADLGLANVDVVLGLRAQRTLADVLDGVCDLEDVIMEAPGGLRVVPASSGVKRMSQLGSSETAGIIHAFSSLSSPPDTLIIDTAAGINESVASFVRAASQVLVVICDEPASLTDAYALIKTLNRHHGMTEFRVLSNAVRSAAQGRDAFDKLARVVDRFLDVSMLYEGFIPEDEFLRRAVRKQSPVVRAFPRCRSSLAFRRLATRVSDWPVSDASNGHVSFFFEQTVNKYQVLENAG
ncbi:MAG: flagellar biosynthesis protein FlhG [Gammaproteobacteria bacterium]|jgi:flagellar biosynthesis protein FlhG